MFTVIYVVDTDAVINVCATVLLFGGLAFNNIPFEGLLNIFFFSVVGSRTITARKARN